MPSQKQPTNASKRWSIDLNLREQDVGYSLLQQRQAPIGMRRVNAIEKQIESEGGTGSRTDKSSSSAMALVAKKKAKAMSVATSPGKQMLMNGFMMYMSGKNLNIFSISITSMALMNPLKSIFTMNNTFRPFEDPDGKVDLQMAKIIFLAMNLVWFSVGLYKMGTMRLLPTTSADWSGYVVWKEMLETSSIPPS
uniref:ER membrane protein complex subunit 4 n=1 Tax=Helicotheca tamesis TaxID=374047 RepID=A0A7S2H7B0_9STRA|mmetsp:Transcript_15809/g.21693  ORF Transcript_15809/g.21693 Transcript_15809/m.21693 type:complete len:194 (+) Transcript_15809:120-701(+)|eukprot:CAMPEP_0185732134 /NCGR_PEP_ID=MMETSP1171-20130828/15135_1 /TAXON_ID=374046 /ORGANISM="Helicotheca tamensis, Strain CCMP826" /LENGTH=193 /DNA_ID=CAMNT_0028401545 /DNA_START=74 /DNA_END=655 /DNA_ORIENTATION=+